MVPQQFVLFLRYFDIEKRILEFVYDLIAYNMRLGLKELALPFWLVGEEVVQSDEHVEVTRTARVCRCVETVFGWIRGIADESWNLDVFEEFLEELDEEGVDLGLIWVDDV